MSAPHAGKAEFFLFKGEPDQSPSHAERPYAFKAYALKHAADAGCQTLLWADASILPIRSLEPLWEKIERDGYWIARNGWTNAQWTSDLAYGDLFPSEMTNFGLERCREVNSKIPHVVATSFGLDLRHEVGQKILEEYHRLASQTLAFCGPWTNLTNGVSNDLRIRKCGPDSVLGHRHDQTALSVIAWRLKCQLTDCPEFFSYRGGEVDKTVIVADSTY